ncbi:MAG: sugar ABC transporter ATP-binding protein [Faecousia sp.]
MKALDNVSFDVRAGEVHVLIGENGAGKSTLLKCILGVYQPNEGKIFFEGKEVHFNTPRDALDNNIVAVYQELTMVPYLNAAQNIYLNREPMYKGTGVVNFKKMQSDAKAYLSELRCEHIDTTVPVKFLDVADHQMIEIAKALSFHPKILILDEPTAPLSSREVESLFEKIRELKKQGVGIIYVSHRMQELREIGDRITVLRDGKLITTQNKEDISDDGIVKAMVGREISQVFNRTAVELGEDALRTENLCDTVGRVQDCSIYVRKGEIVGLAGLVGAGRTELARLIFGIDKTKSGKVYLKGQDITGRKPYQLVHEGLGLLPEDRKRYGVTLKASIAWNTVAVSLKQVFPKFFTSKKKNDEVAERYTKELNIATTGVDKHVTFLSGGNQQKVVIAKWLSADPDVIIFDEPTRGIDVGAKFEIYALMDHLAAEGKAILMISSEMQEVLGMSDRIYVMSDGHIVDEIPRAEFSNERIGKKMFMQETEVAE